MSNKVVVHKDRANTIQIHVGIDISDDVITSEIHSESDTSAPLIATWDVSFLTDGSDGKLVLTMSYTVSSQISVNSGYMDLKRVIGGVGDPVSVFDEPLEVSFRGVVTA